MLDNISKYHLNKKITRKFVIKSKMSKNFPKSNIQNFKKKKIIKLQNLFLISAFQKIIGTPPPAFRLVDEYSRLRHKFENFWISMLDDTYTRQNKHFQVVKNGPFRERLMNCRKVLLCPKKFQNCQNFQ